MIKQGIGVEYIGDIPEFIAQSKDSSYSHAMEGKLQTRILRKI